MCSFCLFSWPCLCRCQVWIVKSSCFYQGPSRVMSVCVCIRTWQMCVNVWTPPPHTQQVFLAQFIGPGAVPGLAASMPPCSYIRDGDPGRLHHHHHRHCHHQCPSVPSGPPTSSSSARSLAGYQTSRTFFLRISHPPPLRIPGCNINLSITKFHKCHQQIRYTL